MALFLHTYVQVPREDLGKATLQNGNPYRDHLLLGAGLMRSSLYKRPKSPDYKVMWIWDDMEFDPFDPYPSEELLLDQIRQEVMREVEHTQQDSQIYAKDHYLIGNDLLPQLGLLYQKSVDYAVDRPELLYHCYLGAKQVELSAMLAMTVPRKTLKPAYTPAKVKELGLGELSTRDMIGVLYLEGDMEGVTSTVTKDLRILESLYHYLLSF